MSIKWSKSDVIERVKAAMQPQVQTQPQNMADKLMEEIANRGNLAINKRKGNAKPD